MSQEYWNLSTAGDSIFIDSSKVFTVFPTTADAFIIESFGIADWIALIAFSITMIVLGALIGRNVLFKNKKEVSMRSSVFAVSLISILILITYGLYLVQRAPMERNNIGIAWYAQYGDAFGVVTSFFTAMGTIGLVVTIVLQYQTLKAQKEELAETREEVKGQRLELEGQKNLMQQQTQILEHQREHGFLQIFLNQYKDYTNGIGEIISNVYEQYHYLDCVELHRAISNQNITKLLDFIENSLVNLGNSTDLIYDTLPESHIKLLVINSLVNQGKYKKIDKLVNQKTSKKHRLEILLVDKAYRRSLINIGLDSLYETMQNISNEIHNHNQGRRKINSRAPIDPTLQRNIELLDKNIGMKISLIFLIHLYPELSSLSNFDFKDRCSKAINTMKNHNIPLLNQSLNEIDLDYLDTEDAKSKINSYMNSNLLSSK